MGCMVKGVPTNEPSYPETSGAKFSPIPFIVRINHIEILPRLFLKRLRTNSGICRVRCMPAW